MKKISGFFLFAVLSLFVSADDPVLPAQPQVHSAVIKADDYNVEFKQQNGKYYQGYFTNLKQIDLSELKWPEKEQDLSINDIKSLKITGYNRMKKNFSEYPFSLVYYIPIEFNITLQDGTILKKVSGRIRDLETFVIDYLDENQNQNKMKFYTYFVRYWLEKDKKFTDNQSADFNESPQIHSETVRLIEF
ncbi:MAG: hypothetical protein MJB14_15865 [Spirochaetes bacterium]|nr:hypothetical protein [Spirochaetota bacterium]